MQKKMKKSRNANLPNHVHSLCKLPGIYQKFPTEKLLILEKFQ